MRLLTWAFIFLLIFGMVNTAAPLTPPLVPIQVAWHGHACFTVTYSKNLRLVIDPFTPGRSSAAPYKTPQLEGEIVLVTHEHFDHNYTAAVKGGPKIIRGAGYQGVRGLNILGIESYHDDQKGQARGVNTIFVWNGNGINFAHLGDLGQKELTAEQLRQMKRWGDIDVLFIPVGGFYTIGPQEAWKIVEQIKPRVVVPIHYKVADVPTDSPLVRVDQFLQGKKGVKYLDTNSFNVIRNQLPKETEIWVLQAKGLLK